jgi:arginyl-tRNA synthetase
VLTAYLFELCRSFSRYYQEHQVLRNTDANLVLSRIELVRGMLQTLKNGMWFLGVPFLEAM